MTTILIVPGSLVTMYVAVGGFGLLLLLFVAASDEVLISAGSVGTSEAKVEWFVMFSSFSSALTSGCSFRGGDADRMRPLLLAI